MGGRDRTRLPPPNFPQAGEEAEQLASRYRTPKNIVADAGLAMARRDLAHFRHGPGAVGHRVGTTRPEHAAGRRIDRARNIAAEHDAPALAVGIRDGNGRQQRLGVGMLRAADELLRRRVLHDAAEIHDDDAVGDVFDDGEIVGDEEVGEAELALQIVQQVDDLRLDRHVERRDRLVGDDELRARGERPGDADALALAAGEFVRIAAHVLDRESDETQKFGDPLAAAGAAAADAVHDQRLADDILDAHARVERGEGVLEDRLRLSAVVRERRWRQRGDVGALEQDGARRRIVEAQDGAPDRRLAGAGFADQAEHLAGGRCVKDTSSTALTWRPPRRKRRRRPRTRS